MRTPTTIAINAMASLSGTNWWLQYPRGGFGGYANQPAGYMHTVGSQRNATADPITITATPDAIRPHLIFVEYEPTASGWHQWHGSVP